ncbi:MAG TPA: hypothetical protein VF808_12270 [Ktedonobacterales bacterium]
MAARTREKPRFKLDVPPPTQGWTVPGKRDPRATRKLTIVNLDVGATPQRPGRPGLRAALRRLAPRQGLLTLAQRRQRRRLVWIGAGAFLAVLAIAGFVVYNASQYTPPLPGPPLSGPEAGVTSSLHPDRTLHFGAVSPLANLTLHTSANGSPAPLIQAKAAFLYDPANGWILYEKNSDQPRSVASLTKIMTLLLAVTSGSLDQPVTVGADAAALVNSNNSYMGLSAGEQLSMRQLLYGLMVPGGNDAAVAVADAVSGDSPTFVALMNRDSVELGLTHTSFVSPDGLDNSNISSARDLAELTAIVIQQPGVAQITSTRYLIIPQTSSHKAYTLYGTNDLLSGGSAAYSGVEGVKSGYTTAAGYCVAFAAVVNGRLLVGVLLGDPSSQARANDAHALLDWGFAQQS